MAMASEHPSEMRHWQLRFFPIWTAQLFSLLGSQLVGFALIWWLTKTTASATVLATASLVGMVPQILLGPIIGTLVDRWNRRLVMIFADSTIALATLLIALLFAWGNVQIWQIYLLMFIRSVAGGFHWPAMQASTSLMVPKDFLARLQGINMMVGGGVGIISAPLGALLIELLPMQGVLGIDVITALIAVSPLLFIPVPQPERSGSAEGSFQSAGESLWKDFRAGLVYVATWRGLMMIGGLAIILNFLLTPAFSLLPILVTNHFKGQALHLAWFNSAHGLGVLLGGLALSVWGGFRRRIHTSLTGLLGMGVGVTLVAIAPGHLYSLALFGLFLTSFFNPIANGPLHAALQAVVKPEMQGRVFTLIGSLASLMSPVGLILAGPLADQLGVRTWFYLGAAGLLILGGGAFFIPEIIHFEDARNGADETKVVASPVKSVTAD